MGRTKIDYGSAEREYVTGGDSYRALSKRYGITFSSMAEWCRKHDWDEKRQAYRTQVSTSAVESTRERHVHE